MAISRIFSRPSLALTKKSLALATNDSVRSVIIYTPPRNRISLAEKVILGTIMSVSALIIPAWVLYHVPEYQGESRERPTEG